MAAENIESADFSETGYSYTLSLISGKYKPVILYCLMEYEPVRFNQMQRYLQDVADKTLSQNLKELESDGLINRKMYPQVPPKVEYTLTARGQSLMKILDQLCVWGQENRSWKDRSGSRSHGRPDMKLDLGAYRIDEKSLSSFRFVRREKIWRLSRPLRARESTY